jgi:hypothetical protein
MNSLRKRWAEWLKTPLSYKEAPPSLVFVATAQEVLGSCIFLFVKHPFDVGGRVESLRPNYSLRRFLFCTRFSALSAGRHNSFPSLHNIMIMPHHDHTATLLVMPLSLKLFVLCFDDFPFSLFFCVLDCCLLAITFIQLVGVQVCACLRSHVIAWELRDNPPMIYGESAS